MKMLAVILLPLVLLAGILLAQAQSPAWWRTPDSSVRMAAQSPATAEKTRSAVQGEIEKPSFHSTPEGSGINWQEFLLFCAVVTAAHALMLKFVVNPEMDRRFAVFRKIMDEDFSRRPERDDELPVTRRENAMQEQWAIREHAILEQRTKELAERMDKEFGRVWSAMKRILGKVNNEEE